MERLIKKIDKDYEEYQSNLLNSMNSSITPDEVLERYAYDYAVARELHYKIKENHIELSKSEIEVLLKADNIIDAFIECWYNNDFSIISEYSNLIDLTVDMINWIEKG